MDTKPVDILPALLIGETQNAIAGQIGRSQSTVSRWKDKLAEHIEAFQIQLIEQSGQATVDNITNTIGRANSILSNPQIKSIDLANFKDLLQLSHKKEVLVAQSMGILPSQTQAITINNMLSVHTGPSVTDIERIQELIQARQEADIVDVTPDSVSSNDDIT